MNANARRFRAIKYARGSGLTPSYNDRSAAQRVPVCFFRCKPRANVFSDVVDDASIRVVRGHFSCVRGGCFGVLLFVFFGLSVRGELPPLLAGRVFWSGLGLVLFFVVLVGATYLAGK